MDGDIMKHQECMFCGRNGEVIEGRPKYDYKKHHGGRVKVIGNKFICFNCCTLLGQATMGAWEVRVHRKKICCPDGRS